MGDLGDAARHLDRAQRMIEVGLAVVIPVLLASMLYSYVLFEELVTPLFVIVIVLCLLLIVPAHEALRLHYRCWALNTMPQRLVTGLIGTIYISAAAVFGVSMMLSYEGLDPGQPLLFTVLVLFVLLLIAVMAYNTKLKDRNKRTDIRFFRKDVKGLTQSVKSACASHAVDCTVAPDGKNAAISVRERKVHITIKRQAIDRSEVMMECMDPISNDLCSEIKRALDQVA